VANQLNTYPTRIPVQAGDVIGYFASTAFNSCTVAAPGYDYSYFLGDPAPGSTDTYALYAGAYQPDIAATLEPDADGDGFGDETQDQCPSDPQIQTTACRDKAAPETNLTKKKVKGRKATFEFSSSEPGTTFKCSVDGKPFEVCTSPQTYKAKPGKHSFYVFGKDAAGNVDDSPATTAFKIKKKKRK
jgi:hypothetical protein